MPDNNQVSTLRGKITSGTTEEAKGKTVKFVKQNITRPMALILLFWVNEDDPATKLFSESAQTRMRNIKKSSWYDERIHKVHCPPIQTLQEIGTIINNWTNSYGGKDKIKTREIGVFSHAGPLDGPLARDTPNNPPLSQTYDDQMAISGGWDAIDFNWQSHEHEPMIVFYGCNSGFGSNSFAQKISALPNFKDVTVWGQLASSYPSFFPDYRVIAPAQGYLSIGWDVGHIYMVGDFKKRSREIVLQGGHIGLSPEKLKDKYYPAEKLRYFKNGIVIGASHQGVFNDHR